VVSNGASTVTSVHWVSPQITVTSQRNGISSSLTLSNVDISRSVSSAGGVVNGSTGSDTLTLTLNVPNGTWSATIATQGAVSYDANGVPTQGSWQMTLPHNRIGLSVAAGSAMLTIDNGPDGHIDYSYTFSVANLAAQAL
jgi:hypothetical protein